MLIIEVDGFAFHENNQVQQARDNMKDDILKKYEVPFLRLQTTGSGEKERIRTGLNEVLNKSHQNKERYWEQLTRHG